MKNRTWTNIVVVAAILFPCVALAHHSFAMFDRDRTVEVSGTVKSVQWTNPHVWVYILTAEKDGAAEEWGFESGPTTTLIRAGFKRDTLKPGDKVTVKYNPMKNGTHAGSLASITPEGGTALSLGIQGAKPENDEKVP